MFLSANNINHAHLMIFRTFVKEHGKIKLRRVLHALDHNHSKVAIAHQLSLSLNEIDDITQIYRQTA